jgi:glycosyltransferase involved in cell wall biosynthesis
MILGQKASMPEKPFFSIIVCTALRINLLRKCLESLLSQTISSSAFEIIVINNVVEDEPEIDTVIRQIDTEHRISVATERIEGLSPARNHGIALAKGDILVFIDDDAVANPGWLEEISRVYVDHPESAAVGGKIELFWESARPDWLHPDLHAYLGELDYGNGILQIKKEQRLGGGNFSIRRCWLEKCGGFLMQLGRNRKSLLSGEEVELLLRVQANGGKCYYTSDALVYHPAAASRLTKNYFRWRTYWGARSTARIDKIHAPGEIMKNLTSKLIRIPYHLLHSAWFGCTQRSALSFLWETYVWSTSGYFVEVIQRTKQSA